MIECNCDYCGLSVRKVNKDYYNFKKHFCTSSCRASYYNKLKTVTNITKNKFKNIKCYICKTLVSVNVHASNVICQDCKIKPKKINCILCKCTIESLGKPKYCNSCKKIILIQSGLKSISRRKNSNRSKNEILFGELLQNNCKYKLLFNDTYFKDKNNNYWDADIIIPELKLAIHWNGTWHYKSISKNPSSSLARIQSRDKIKHSVIADNGFYNYIIKDLGKFSVKKVNEEIFILLNNVMCINIYE